MSAASVKQKRRSPSTAKAYGVQPNARTSSWRLAALAAPSGRGGAQTPTDGNGPGSASPRRGPPAVELLPVGAGRVARVGAVEVQQVLALDVEDQHPHPPAHLLVLEHEPHQRQRGAGLGRDAADARDGDVAALGAVEEVEVEVDRLAVAAQADGQPARHRVLVEGHGRAPSPRARRTGRPGWAAIQRSGSTRTTCTSAVRTSSPGIWPAAITLVSEGSEAPS